ncbi:MAG: LemA family protein [Planctomycetota bacterium]
MIYALIGGAVFLVLLLVVVFYGVAVYNRLVQLRERTRNAWAQIDVQLLRRHDLIPNLVETAKGYLDHERETLEAVMEARAKATQAQVNLGGDPTNAGAMRDLAASEGLLTGALGKLMAVVEAYPDLKADQNMQQLSEELTSTENKVAFSRQAFNDSTNTYNAYKQTFPPVLFANVLGFKDAEYFEVKDEAQRAAPKVSF